MVLRFLYVLRAKDDSPSLFGHKNLLVTYPPSHFCWHVFSFEYFWGERGGGGRGGEKESWYDGGKGRHGYSALGYFFLEKGVDMKWKSLYFKC